MLHPRGSDHPVHTDTGMRRPAWRKRAAGDRERVAAAQDRRAGGRTRAAGRDRDRTAMRAHHRAGAGQQGWHQFTSSAPLLIETPEPTSIVREPAFSVAEDDAMESPSPPLSCSFTVPALLSRLSVPACVMMLLTP